MDIDGDLPFYLMSNRKNVISKSEIQKFRADNPELSEYIDSHKIELRPLEISNFEALCCWIIGQQISSKVARSITKRFRTYTDITPEGILEKSFDELKSIGFSKSKTKYVQNLATFFISNKMPDFNKMTNKEIIKYFSQVKGIGEWTVQMHLIFAFGRKNILAVKDLVVRKGIQRLYSLTNVPSEKEAKIIGTKWGELATIGTLLSWSIMGE